LLNTNGFLDVLATILTAAPIEAVHVMQPSSEFTTLDHKGEVPIFDNFRELIRKQNDSLDLQKVERFAFYDCAREKNVTLAIQTGETRLYGNIMLTIGVRHPKE
jgi:L-fucose mutarotase